MANASDLQLRGCRLYFRLLLHSYVTASDKLFTLLYLAPQNLQSYDAV